MISIGNKHQTAIISYYMAIISPTWWMIVSGENVFMGKMSVCIGSANGCCVLNAPHQSWSRCESINFAIWFYRRYEWVKHINKKHTIEKHIACCTPKCTVHTRCNYPGVRKRIFKTTLITHLQYWSLFLTLFTKIAIIFFRSDGKEVILWGHDGEVMDIAETNALVRFEVDGEVFQKSFRALV